MKARKVGQMVRMSNHLLSELDNGDHAIIRHFQEDVNEHVLLTQEAFWNFRGGFLIQGRQ